MALLLIVVIYGTEEFCLYPYCDFLHMHEEIHTLLVSGVEPFRFWGGSGEVSSAGESHTQQVRHTGLGKELLQPRVESPILFDT